MTLSSWPSEQYLDDTAAKTPLHGSSLARLAGGFNRMVPPLATFDSIASFVSVELQESVNRDLQSPYTTASSEYNEDGDLANEWNGDDDDSCPEVSFMTALQSSESRPSSLQMFEADDDEGLEEAFFTPSGSFMSTFPSTETSFEYYNEDSSDFVEEFGWESRNRYILPDRLSIIFEDEVPQQIGLGLVRVESSRSTVLMDEEMIWARFQYLNLQS